MRVVCPDANGLGCSVRRTHVYGGVGKIFQCNFLLISDRFLIGNGEVGLSWRERHRMSWAAWGKRHPYGCLFSQFVALGVFPKKRLPCSTTCESHCGREQQTCRRIWDYTDCC